MTLEYQAIVVAGNAVVVPRNRPVSGAYEFPSFTATLVHELLPSCAEVFMAKEV